MSIQIDRSTTEYETFISPDWRVKTEQEEAVTADERGVDGGPVHRRRASQPEPVDWDIAVRAAELMLNERFGPPGPHDSAAMGDMAAELAARLCAFDKINDAVDHLRAHEDAAAGAAEPAGDGRDTPTPGDRGEAWSGDAEIGRDSRSGT